MLFIQSKVISGHDIQLIEKRNLRDISKMLCFIVYWKQIFIL